MNANDRFSFRQWRSSVLSRDYDVFQKKEGWIVTPLYDQAREQC
jgi:hypothetical protein